MKIRRAKKEDLKEIDRIYVEGSIDEGKLQFPKTWKDVVKDLEKHKKERVTSWEKELKDKNNYWIVAEEKEEIVGFGNVEIKKNYDRKEGMLTMVYVDRKIGRKGIGIKILKELVRWLRKNKIKIIESAGYVNNKPSLEMQKKFGFRPISVKMRLEK